MESSTNKPTKASAREKLKAFYNLNKVQNSEINESNFEYRPYLNKLYTQQDLKGLIERDVTLLTDIRELNSDGKNLVYENYSKFIKANESIRSMRDNLDNMFQELSVASECMDLINKNNNQMDIGLEESRKELGKYLNINDMLKKFKFIFQLPATLSGYIDKEMYLEAINYYLYTKKLVDKYQSMKLFTEIEKEAKSLIKKVEDILRFKISNENNSILELNYWYYLLIKLKDDYNSNEKLYNDFCNLIFKRFSKILNQHHLLLIKEINKNNALVEFSFQIDWLKGLNNEFFLQLNEFIESFHGYYFQSEKELKANNVKSTFLETINKLLDLEYNNTVLKLIKIDNIKIKSNDLNHITSIYSSILTDLATYSSLCGSKMSEINLLQKIRLMICDFEQKLIENKFNAIQQEYINKIMDINMEKGYLNDIIELQSKIVMMKNWLLQNMMELLSFFKSFLEVDIPFWQLSGTWALFYRYLQTKLNQFFKSILTESIKMKDNELLLLLNSKWLLDFYDNFVASIYTNYITTLIIEINIPYSHQPSQEEVILEWEQECENVMNLSRAYSSQILNTYIRSIGNNLTKDILNFYSSYPFNLWPTITQVNSLWLSITQMFVSLTNLSAIFPAKDNIRSGSNSMDLDYRMPSRNSLQLMSPTKNKTFTGLFLNKKNELQPDLWLNKIDKLFSDKIEIYSNTGFTVDDIMIQLAKITLKATSEAIRLSAFNQNAFYQLQLDLEYFQRKLPVFVKLDNSIQSLFNEVISSGFKRAIITERLDPIKIDQILGPENPI